MVALLPLDMVVVAVAVLEQLEVMELQQPEVMVEMELQQL
jgi:hypothetical protein